MSAEIRQTVHNRRFQIHPATYWLLLIVTLLCLAWPLSQLYSRMAASGYMVDDFTEYWAGGQAEFVGSKSVFRPGIVGATADCRLAQGPSADDVESALGAWPLSCRLACLITSPPASSGCC